MRERSRRIVLGLLLAIAPRAASAASCTSEVAVFDDSGYVDTAGGSTAESDTLQTTLVSLGQSIHTFSGISSAAFANAVAGRHVLAIPELESGDLGPALSGAAETVIRDFVNNGGSLLLMGAGFGGLGNDARFLNHVFGFGLSTVVVGTGNTVPNGGSLTAAAAGTAFAGGPASLPDPTATLGISSSLPPGSSVIYNAGGNATVALIPFGAGRIVFLGWDWFDAQPLGGTNGGWLTVLDSAIEELHCRTVDIEVDVTDVVDPVVAGSGSGNMVFHVAVRNHGPATATFLQVRIGLATTSTGISLDSVTPSVGTYNANLWVIPSLAAGASGTLTLVFSANASADGGTMQVDANLEAVNQPRRNATNDSDLESTTVVRRVDLRLTKTESADPVSAGSGAGNLTYVVTLANLGPSDASGVAVLDVYDFPSGVSFDAIAPAPGTFAASVTPGQFTWFVPTLPAGASVTLGLTFTVGSTAAVGTDVIGDTASVSGSNELLINTGDDFVTVRTSIARLVDLVVSQVESIDPVIAGSGPGNLAYTVTVQNLGPSVATGVKLSEVLSVPTGATLDAVIPGGSTTYGSGIWTVGDLAVGGSATLSTTLTVGASAAGGALASSTATVTSVNETRTNTGDDTSVAQTTVGRRPDLAITKTDLVDPVSAGSTLIYLVTVTNNGPSDATGVTVTDTLPSQLTLSSATPSAGICAPAGSTVTCVLGALARGASASVVVDATVSSTAAGTISNTASATVASPDVDPTTPNQSTSLTTVLGQADLTLAKSDAPDPVIAGNTLTYTLTASNLGPGTATGVVLTDPLPAGLAFVSASPPTLGCTVSAGTLSCSLGTVAPGASVPVTVTTTVSASASGTLTNTATVLGNQPDPVPANNVATATTTVGPPYDLEVTLTDQPDPVPVGGILVLSATVLNHGPSSATGVQLVVNHHLGLTVTAATPGQGSCTPGTGVVLCSLGTVASGASVAASIQATAGASAVGTIQTTAGVAGQGVDSNPANDGAVAQTTVQAVADLAVTLTDSPDPLAVAGTLVYTATVTNGGPATAGGVTLSLPLPSGLTALGAQPAQGSCAVNAGTVSCNLQSIASGASVVTQVSAQVGSTAAASLSATATVASTGIDPAPANNSATATTTVSLAADLSLTATDTPDPVSAGGTLTYALTVANAGPAQATSVVLTVNLPSGLQLTAGQSELPAEDDLLLKSELERAGFAAQGFEANRIEVAGLAPRGTVLIFADGFESGDFSAWSLVVGGPSGGSGPPGCSQSGAVVTCALGTIAAGASTQLDLELAVPPMASGTLNASATVSSAVSDPQGTNNATTLATSVTRYADLALSVAASPGLVSPGGIVTYTWTVENGGPTMATGIELNDPLPPELTLLSAVPSQGSCNAASLVSCQLGTLAAEAQATVVVRAVVSGSASGSLTNTASVEATEVDLDLVDNTATAITAVTGN